MLNTAWHWSSVVILFINMLMYVAELTKPFSGVLVQGLLS